MDSCTQGRRLTETSSCAGFDGKLTCESLAANVPGNGQTGGYGCKWGGRKDKGGTGCTGTYDSSPGNHAIENGQSVDLASNDCEAQCRSSTSKSGGISDGAIAGIAIACSVAVIGVAVALWRKKKAVTSQHDAENPRPVVQRSGSAAEL